LPAIFASCPAFGGRQNLGRSHSGSSSSCCGDRVSKSWKLSASSDRKAVEQLVVQRRTRKTEAGVGEPKLVSLAWKSSQRIDEEIEFEGSWTRPTFCLEERPVFWDETVVLVETEKEAILWDSWLWEGLRDIVRPRLQLLTRKPLVRIARVYRSSLESRTFEIAIDSYETCHEKKGRQ
jgi:hypothetical protein